MEIPIDSDEADEENKTKEGRTLLNIISRGFAVARVYDLVADVGFSFWLWGFSTVPDVQGCSAHTVTLAPCFKMTYLVEIP